MYRILLIHEARTAHARAVRRQTGSNAYRDKQWLLRRGDIMQCIGTTLTPDNLLTICYE